MQFNKTAFVALFALISTFFINHAAAQEIDFLPDGVFSSGIELTTSNYNSILEGSNKTELLADYLDRNSIEEDAVTGDLAFSSNVLSIKLQYGLYDNLNVAVVVPFIVNKRESNLTVHDTSNPENVAFASKYETAETQGLGDMSLITFWRPVYSDTNDFRVRVEVNGNNGVYYLSDSDNVSLGNGANDVGLFLRWIIYSSESQFSIDIEAGAIATETVNITEDGTDYEISKGNDVLLSIDLTDTIGPFSYGGGIKAVTGGKTVINKEDQGDNYLAYSYRLFANFGNLSQLENSTVDLPWSAGFYLENIFNGSNAPSKSTIGLKGTVYF